MTNGVAITLVLCILAGLTIDYVWYDFEGALFLARKSLTFLDWLAFWR